MEGKSLNPPWGGGGRQVEDDSFPLRLSDGSFSGASAVSSTFSCPWYSPEFCLWPCALCHPSLPSHSCLRLSPLHPPLHQATTSKRLSEVSSQHQTQVFHCLLDQGLKVSISHTSPSCHGGGQPHLHAHFPTRLWSSCFSATVPDAHVVFHPAGTLSTGLFCFFYFFLPRHPHGQTPGLVPH